MRHISKPSFIISLFSGRTELDVFCHIAPWTITVFFFIFTSCLYSSSATQAAEPIPNPKPVAMLDAAGIDASLRVYLVQGRAWDVLENETLVKILYRLPTFPRLLTERWVFPWDEKERQTVTADPGAWQGQFFQLRFTALTLRMITLPPEAVRRFGFAEYYQLQVDLSDGSTPAARATIFARSVPKAWASKVRSDASDRIDEPGGAVAMFLKRGDKGRAGEGGTDASVRSATPSAFYFVTDRVAWYPKTILGQLGMDVGLFDLIRDRKRIDGEERETFYQLLAAVSRAKPGSLRKAAEAEQGKDKDGHQKWTTVASLFNRPEQMRGNLALLSGDVRRAIRVEVRDPDIVERFGIRHYYELYLFTQDSQNNPIVVCVRDLPKGMPVGSGRDYCEPIEIAGIMLKSWAFTPKRTAEGKEGELQLAPLLIGRKPVWIERAKHKNSPWTGPIVTTVLVIGFFLLWYFLRRQAKVDRVAKKRRQEF